MNRLVGITILDLMLIALVATAKDPDWQTGRLVDIQQVTLPAQTVMVPRPEYVPPPPLDAQRVKGIDPRIPTQVGTIKTVSAPVTIPARSSLLYRIETDTMIYVMASDEILDVTLKAPIKFAFEKDKAYILQDSQKKAKVNCVRKEAK